MTARWHINIITLFPEMFPGPLGQSLSGKALENGKWSFKTVNIRDFAEGVHKSVDDTPYGGGAGMVMRPDIIEKAVRSIENPGRKIYLSPRGTPLTQKLAQELSEEPVLTLLCGRYEGVDQRVLDSEQFKEISIGDYVLSGGEPAALILMDACIRLLPEVVGNAETTLEESFSGGLLEYPHYTRPAEWRSADGQTRAVPEILTSGNHRNIALWRKKQAETLTQSRRPDLWQACQEKSGKPEKGKK
ncbi:MAG: tRNA (guanosine(37)-N1)-methyltransferase TrmD [Rhodospirillales bacterium]|nr:tRNA (guanosine(37)-N1)-methyltransferase TrmD [Alphaproteobacteria bacterium]MCB1840025.1 tRNA (guanosine(37)-N1)-methyltransferase TrmD [Alphaproteobacteria bacterium]MCB9976668.1 tRNA (guanosine(37)-N1)-methyltransferase TrmD [Rhodospirillales bacterium]